MRDEVYNTQMADEIIKSKDNEIESLREKCKELEKKLNTSAKKYSVGDWREIKDEEGDGIK